MPEAPLPRPHGIPLRTLNWGKWCLRGMGGLVSGGVKVYAALSISGLVVLSAYFVTRIMDHQMGELQEQAWDGMFDSK